MLLEWGIKGGGGGGGGGHCSHTWPRIPFPEGGDFISNLNTIGIFGESEHSQTSALLQPCSRCCSMVSAEALMLCTACGAGLLSPGSLKQHLLVATATWHCYNLPLQRPLTTDARNGHRQGFVLQVQLRQGDALFCGIGEVAPLPGGSLSLLLVTFKQDIALLLHLLKCILHSCSARHSHRMNLSLQCQAPLRLPVSSVVELCSS